MFFKNMLLLTHFEILMEKKTKNLPTKLLCSGVKRIAVYLRVCVQNHYTSRIRLHRTNNEIMFMVIRDHRGLYYLYIFV